MDTRSRHVRVAGVEDARAIAEVHVASWLAAYRGIIDDEVLDGLSVDARAARWEDNLTNPKADATTLLVEDGRVMGFAGVGHSQDPDRAAPECGELYAIYLHPDAWGRGAGRLLMDDAVTRLRDGGYADATLWVLTANQRARRFYEHMAWEHDGTAKFWKAAETATPIEEVRYRIDLR